MDSSISSIRGSIGTTLGDLGLTSAGAGLSNIDPKNGLVLHVIKL